MTRKFSEALLAFKIEHSLSKDEILELYFNQIYLGQRAYGFAAAAQVDLENHSMTLISRKQQCLQACRKHPHASTRWSIPTGRRHDSSMC